MKKKKMEVVVYVCEKEIDGGGGRNRKFPSNVPKQNTFCDTSAIEKEKREKQDKNH